MGLTSPISPLPWREGLGEGAKHTPGIVKLWESTGKAGGLPLVNYKTARNIPFLTPRWQGVSSGYAAVFRLQGLKMSMLECFTHEPSDIEISVKPFPGACFWNDLKKITDMLGKKSREKNRQTISSISWDFWLCRSVLPLSVNFMADEIQRRASRLPRWVTLYSQEGEPFYPL